MRAISRGAEVVYSDRRRARSTFSRIATTSPLAHTYLALMDAEDGRVGTDAGDARLPHALMNLRYAFEQLEQACQGKVDQAQIDQLWPCTLHARHADLFSEVLAAHHYSSRDNIMMLVTRRCIDRLLGQRLPPDRARAVTKAELAIRLAALEPGPPTCGNGYCGTIWYGVMIDAAAPISHALLAPDAISLAEPNIGADLPENSAALKRALLRHSKALGDGICAAAAARGKKWRQEHCEGLARSVAAQARRRWLSRNDE